MTRPIVLLSTVIVLVASAAASLVHSGALASDEGSPRLDRAFLISPRWDDGKAEIAFYQVERSRDQYGRANAQRFLAGTYLVTQEFDQGRESKARRDATERVASFKAAIFYEFESTNSYQYKRSYVVNATQDGLRPLKQSINSFDWCSNQYRELSFRPDGRVGSLRRSDDYGNDDRTFGYRANAYPVALVPLLARAADLRAAEPQPFSIVLEDGRYVDASLERGSTATLETPDGPTAAEAVIVRYTDEVPSLIGETADRVETYWRAAEGDRVILRLQSGSRRYAMTLVERVRSAYWRDNVYEILRRVSDRP